MGHQVLLQTPVTLSGLEPSLKTAQQAQCMEQIPPCPVPELVKKIAGLRLSFLLRSLICAVCLVHLPVHSGSDDQAYARVQASHTALQSAERDFRLSRSRGDLSAREAADYRAYIAHLRRRFFGACADLSQLSEQRIALETPCPFSPPRITGAAEIDLTREQTHSERTTALGRDLDAALSDFDEMLLREQERVKAATPPPTARTAGGTGQGTKGADRDGRVSGDRAGEDGRPAGELATSGGPGETSATGAETGAIATAAGAGAGAGAAPPGRSGSPTGRPQTARRGLPPDIPDGSDDDVVARQLREAAEKETNPELRARLWEEYRRYKRGTP